MTPERAGTVAAVDGQIDIAVSRLRSAGLVLIAAGFTAGCAWMLYARPETHGHAFVRGGFTEFALWFGILFFGAASLVGVPRMFRSGTMLSLGRRGIFDRRLSTDWIPWDAIEDIRSITVGRQRFVALRLDPARSGSLPILAGRRRSASFTGLGPSGYALGANDLEGGFKGLTEALARSESWRDHAATGSR